MFCVTLRYRIYLYLNILGIHFKDIHIVAKKTLRWMYTHVVIYTTPMKLVLRQILQLTHALSADSAIPNIINTKKWNELCQTALFDVYPTDLVKFEQLLYSWCWHSHSSCPLNRSRGRRPPRGVLACEWPLWLDKQAYRNNWLAYFRYLFLYLCETTFAFNVSTLFLLIFFNLFCASASVSSYFI